MVERRHGWVPGPHESPLSVKWFQPADPVAAPVLVVRSIGHEDDAAGHGMHHLGLVLANAGHPVVLLSLSGGAQSFGLLDAGAPDRWIEEVEHVAHRLAGPTPRSLVVVGYRVGALVAAHAIGRDAAEAVGGAVLWHLPNGGRRVVRELRVMAAAQQTLDVELPEGELRIGAHRYQGAFLDALGAMPTPPAAPPHLAVDLIAPVRGTVAEPLAAALAAAGASLTAHADDVDWVTAGGSDDVVLPEATIRRIVGHASLVAPSGVLDAARMGFSTKVRPSGGALREETHTFDDGRLVGVLTRPAGAASSTAVLLLSARGPGNGFVDLARTEAVRGRASLRFDLSGFGMNAPRPGHAPGEIYTSTGALDVAKGVAALQMIGYRSVVVIGFCAGGWAALRARPVIPAAAVVAINVELYARSSAWMRRREDAAWPRRQLQRARAAWRKATRSSDVRPAAARWIRHLVKRGTHVHLVYDEHDTGHLHWRSFVARRLRRPLRDGGVTVVTYPALGHFTEGPDGDAMLAGLGTFVDELAARPAPRSARR